MTNPREDPLEEVALRSTTTAEHNVSPAPRTWQVVILLVTLFALLALGIWFYRYPNMFLSHLRPELRKPVGSVALDVDYYGALLVLPVAYAIWAFLLSRPLRTIGLVGTKSTLAKWANVACAPAAFLVCVTMLCILRGPLQQWGVIKHYRYPPEYFLSIVILCPLYEEIVFRRLLFRFLLSRTSTWKAILVSSTIFGYFHLGSYPLPINEFIGGVIFCGLYLWRKTLLAPLAAHVGANFAQAVVESFVLS